MEYLSRIQQSITSLFLGLFLCCFLVFGASSQEQNAPIQLKIINAGNPNSTYIDTAYQYMLPAWRRERNGQPVNIGYALHKTGEELTLLLSFDRKLKKQTLSALELVVLNNQDSLFLAFKRVDSNTVKLRIREPLGTTVLQVFHDKQLLGSVEIDVFPQRKETVYLVPLFDFELDEKNIANIVNQIFEPFNVSFAFELLPSFSSLELEKSVLLDNPSPEFDHYTRQMRHIRDGYFKTFPNSNKQAYYVFIHQGFINDGIEGYASKGKAISFVKHQEAKSMSYSIAVQLARGIGGMAAISDKKQSVYELRNLMQNMGGIDLSPEQWRQLHLDFRGYPYYDEDEEINTFNGFVAYYFWEENEDGSIVFNPGAFRRAIQRPYKKNYFSYHLNIEKRLFKPWFHVLQFPISPLHLIFFLCYAALAYWLRKKWERRLTHLIERKLKIRKIIGRVAMSFAVFVITILTFSTINGILARYEIYDGIVPDFRGLDSQEVRKQILYSNEIRRFDLPEMASEVLIKRGDDWIVKRRKRVLYFDLQKDSAGVYSMARFNRESDSIVLQTAGIALFAPSHYFVISRIDENQNYESQMVYNHQGSNVTNLLQFREDPAKRILLFVNGYRPTSLGNSLEDNFRDIRQRGVEFPNSKNMIYDFDRYDYWRPWREIDLRFEKRINPSATYYADGHFSVSTSNYRSLIHFTQISARYPTRCKNPEQHTCQNQGRTSWFRSSDDATYQLLPNRPNYSGFKKRMENGRIAGLNLLQQLNEIPNSSANDTLFIVAHSMGYAYALGMVEELRGKINFGGFYILAPENASAGYVNPSEWKEIWQYGVDQEALKKSAPCMLDGVAPQTRAQGLAETHQVFIPKELFRRFGFFDSHFVGFYDWIFDLNEAQPGNIPQR